MNDLSLYPMVSWTVTMPAFTVTVTIDSVTEVLSFAGGVLRGWNTTGAVAGLSSGSWRDAPAGTIAAAFASLLATHTQAGPVDAYYGWSNGSVALVQGGSGQVGYLLDYNPPDPSGGTIDATSDATALAYFGLKVGDSLPQSVVVNRRTAGVWRPKFAPVAQLEPVMSAIGSGAMSDYTASVHDRLLFSGRIVWSALWEYVEAADISRELLDVQDYLPLALRATGDTAGVLDDLLWVLANAKSVYLALPPVQLTAAIEYKEAVLGETGDLTRDAFTTEAAVASRRYNVTMAFVETTNYTPGTLL